MRRRRAVGASPRGTSTRASIVSVRAGVSAARRAHHWMRARGYTARRRRCTARGYHSHASIPSRRAVRSRSPRRRTARRGIGSGQHRLTPSARLHATRRRALSRRGRAVWAHASPSRSSRRPRRLFRGRFSERGAVAALARRSASPLVLLRRSCLRGAPSRAAGHRTPGVGRHRPLHDSLRYERRSERRAAGACRPVKDADADGRRASR